MREKHLYVYEGNVKVFDQIVAYKWSASTYAISERQARNNLAFRFKKETNRTANVPVELTGSLERRD